MADMEPVQILSTPPFSSNDPATEGLKMVPVDDNPPADDHEESDIEDADESDEDPSVRIPAPSEQEEEGSTEGDADKKAGEWVAEINAAQDQDALDAVLTRYDATGKDFKSVADAADARQDALNS